MNITFAPIAYLVWAESLVPSDKELCTLATKFHDVALHDGHLCSDAVSSTVSEVRHDSIQKVVEHADRRWTGFIQTGYLDLTVKDLATEVVEAKNLLPYEEFSKKRSKCICLPRLRISDYIKCFCRK